MGTQKVMEHTPFRDYEELQVSLPTLSPEEFRMPKNRRLVKDLLQQRILKEGPLSLDQLYRQTLKAFGVRYTKKSVDTMDQVVSSLGFTMKEEGDRLFVYGQEEPGTLTQYRVPTKSFRREPEDLPEEELILVLKDLLQSQISMPEEALIVETLKLFGFTRGHDAFESKLRHLLKKEGHLPFLERKDKQLLFKA